MPSRPLCGTFLFSRCITSGSKSASHALLTPDLSHQEIPNMPSRHLCSTFRRNFVYQGPSVTLSDPSMLLSVFLTYHVRTKNGLPRTFSSRRVTSGNPQPTMQCPLWSIPVFLTYHVRMKNGLPRTFSSRRITLGNPQPAMQCPLWSIPVFLTCNVRTKNAIPRWFCS